MSDEGLKGQVRIDRRNLSWFLFFRLLVVSLCLGGTVVYQWRSEVASPPQLPFFYTLIVLTYLQTILSAHILSTAQRLVAFARFQIAWDLILASLVIYLTGAFESQFSFLYILIVFSSSLFLKRRDVLFAASAASIFYGCLLDFQYFGILPAFGHYAPPEIEDGGKVLYAVFVNVVAFLLIALLSAQLAERGRRSQRALERKEVDLEELESLNRAIIANITSGLMLVNDSGRIRSFNAAASKITGYSLNQVYDRNVEEIFPNFNLFDGAQFNVVSRGQGEVKDKSGGIRTLGFATSMVRDADYREIGLLVIFQDLTDLLAMEDQLRRSDRLAAVGRLASGMAHEIRNPLASISGSVQLLMEGENVSDEDRKLMGIVVREADRLSGLLTNFLSFARPAKPVKTECSLASVFDELLAILHADSRFDNIKVVIDSPPGRNLYVDRQMLHQVLLDLVINSAEAISGGGMIRVGSTSGSSLVFVEDNGPGIDEKNRGKIFEFCR